MPKRTVKAKGSGKARAGNLPQAKQDNVASQQSTETVDKQEFSEEQDSSDEQENCDVCCDVCCTPIVDGRDDALQCEGVCQKWLHRLCAGVSKSHHNALSNSSTPFTCWLCSHTLHQATVSQLHSEIAALRTEVAKLRAIHEMAHSAAATEAGSWSEVVRRKGSSNKKSVNVENKKSGNVETGKPSSKKKTTAGDATQKQDPHPPLHGKQSRDKDRNPPRTRIQVEGKRKVWGTMKTCSTAAVKSAISTLTNVPSDELSIRRKYKIATTNAERVVKWWFVIGGEERVIAQLQEQWPTVNFQTKWKLEPVYCYSEASQPDQPDQTRNITEPPKSPPHPPEATTPMATNGLGPSDPLHTVSEYATALPQSNSSEHPLVLHPQGRSPLRQEN